MMTKTSIPDPTVQAYLQTTTEAKSFNYNIKLFKLHVVQDVAHPLARVKFKKGNLVLLLFTSFYLLSLQAFISIIH